MDLGFGTNYSNSSDDDEEYVIEKIVDERGTGKKKEYLVKFKDYGDEDNTWTTSEDVSPELIKEYENKKKSQQNGDEDDEEFVIEKIVDERGTGKKKEYLVKFKDYGDEDNTWTSKDDVSTELIKEYENKKKQDSQPEQNGDEYEIEKIVEERTVGKNKEYLVKWKGWKDEDNTWEPKENLTAAIIKKYEAEAKKQKDSASAKKPGPASKKKVTIPEKAALLMSKKMEKTVKKASPKIEPKETKKKASPKMGPKSKTLSQNDTKKSRGRPKKDDSDDEELEILEEHIFEKILDDRTMGKKKEYYVKWKNSVKNTWEPKEKLSLENIEAYESKKGIKHEHKKEEEYTIEKILEDRFVGKKGDKKKEYLVKWKDWIISTWEPEEYLSSEVPDIVQEYESKNKNKPAVVKKQTPKKSRKNTSCQERETNKNGKNTS